jgi:UDP-N-acetylmuramoyl-tripeptide--D-alanyl-D-alanine ligase
MINLNLINTCSSLIAEVLSFNENHLPFCVDTRKYKHPSAFVAIPGNKINPLDVIDSLLQKKCPYVFFQQNQENDSKVSRLKELYPATHFLPVADSIIFLQELAQAHVNEWKNKSPHHTIFAISGSNGKTTHKEMLAFLLKNVLPGKVVSTEKNNNNHLGVPLTLLEISESTEFVVLELGSNHPGEIKVLCDIAQPNAGITTNIGATHLEFFGSEEKVFDEEAYLYHAVKEQTNGQGFYLINKDDEFLRRLVPTAGSVTYGTFSDVMAAVNFSEQGATIQWAGQSLEVSNEFITGRHNKLNLITCLFIAHHFYPGLSSQFRSAAAEFKPTKNRSEWITFEGKSVFLDAYNANPSSMRAALEGFKENALEQGYSLDQTCIVLGDMNELGDSAPKYHQDLGKFVKELGFSHVYFVGRYAQFYREGFPGGSDRPSSAAFKAEYRGECLKRFPLHFIKGSRSLQLESLFDIT